MDEFTAWITTDPACLDGGRVDVAVLRDEHNGDLVGDWLWYDVTTVDAEAGSDQDAIREAGDMLHSAGWRVAGGWVNVPTGYIAKVERA